MKHNFIKDHAIVWVRNGKSEYIGRISRVHKDAADVTNLSTDETNREYFHNLFETASAPIDEKNIISDWINEDLLDNCAQNGNEYLGWFQDKYPVYGKINKNGTLTLKPMDDSVIPSLKARIESIFACENNIQTIFKEDTCLNVAFYFTMQ